MEILFYLLLGILAGAASGLLGIGGGIILIPVFLALFRCTQISPNIAMHLAIGTSLATMMIISFFSARAHHKRDAVTWPLLKILIPGILIGAPLGSAIASMMESQSLEILFGCFMIAAAFQMVIKSHHAKESSTPKQPTIKIFGIAGIVIGFMAGLLGVGGGVFTVPFLIWKNVSPTRAIGTATACAFPIGVAGSIGYLFMGWHNPLLPPYSAGYIFLPAVALTAFASIFGTELGASLAHRLPTHKLVKVFALVLAGVGIKMIF